MVMLIPSLLFLFLSVVSFSAEAKARTMRYRSGSLIVPNEDSDVSSQGRLLATYTDISVPDVRKRCTLEGRCVSFSYRSDHTRFPSNNVTAHLFAHADWHVELNEDSPVSIVNTIFVDDSRYHTYVNVTRERNAVTREVGSLMKLLMKTEMSEGSVASEESSNNNKSRLRARGRNTAESDSDASQIITSQKLMVLQAIFDIVYNKELRLLAAPLVVPWASSLGSSDTERAEVRENALTILMVMADGVECLPTMMQHGIFSSMKNIISEQLGANPKASAKWSHICKLSLDVISNIAIHRAVNDDLRREGATSFLQKLISRPGFPGLQATMALTHLSDKLEPDVIKQLPPEKLDDLVNLMRAAIDGDIAYENKWDLVPGPLSSIKYLIYQSSAENGWVCDGLLKAGLMEQLLRVLEADCLDAIDIETALETLWGLSRVSEEGRHMIVMAEHSIHEAGIRLARYDKASKLAYGLVESAGGNFNNAGSEL
uniref:Uncharacterized protein n=1 Tax=Minutocellus polymorphus TaxID=265543 RepID=A0A7S0AU52_9STRA